MKQRKSKLLKSMKEKEKGEKKQKPLLNRRNMKRLQTRKL